MRLTPCSYQLFLTLSFLLLTACDAKTVPVDSCGDGFVDPGEDCDLDVGTNSCASMGHYRTIGVLGCNTDCTFDLSDCAGRCGDEIVDMEYGEECDGPNLNGNNCLSIGYQGGTLSCLPGCRFDTSLCTNLCGNGYREGGETCDDGNLTDGDGCSASCEMEPGWNCDDANPSRCETICLDGMAVGDEICDTTDLRDQTCEGFGFHAGQLACTQTCELDMSACEQAGRCGDGTFQEAFEQCEGANLNQTTCRDRNFFTGDLSCGADCLFEETPCNDVSQLSAGGLHTCVVLTDETAKCWGNNAGGQIGDGTNTHRLTPVSVIGLAGVLSIHTGSNFSCALLVNHNLKCWGNNTYGQLGDGTNDDRNLTVDVLGLDNVQKVATGYSHVCAVLADGTAKCWGSNQFGKLGDGTTTARNSPVTVNALSAAVDITASEYHSCALINDGTIRCWGVNWNGQLGTGDTVDSLTPVTTSGISGATAISGGYSHTCTLLSGGTVKCWGVNDYGQLGDGSTVDRASPVLVGGLLNVLSISAGGRHSCALLQNGTARCWGANFRGQVGDGTTEHRSSPVGVSGLTDSIEVVAGGDHSCSVDASRKLAHCWGLNSYGRIGDGTIIDRWLPTLVSP